jgi:hypothetical protein
MFNSPVPMTVELNHQRPYLPQLADQAICPVAEPSIFSFVSTAFQWRVQEDQES